MKTFTIDTDLNITAHATRESAEASLQPYGEHGGHIFSTADGLKTALKNYAGTAALAVWNSLAGVKPVKKFTSADVAAKRIFAELRKLEARDTTEATPVPAPGKKAKKVAKSEKKTTTAKAAKKTRAPNEASSGPRAASKAALLIEMLKRPGGATLDEVTERFGWLVHTTRALMSAGGSLTKKHGISVISEKVNDVRTYRLGK